jgi:pyruvate,water dikinase
MLEETGRAIRELILRSEFPDEVAKAIREGYRELSRR